MAKYRTCRHCGGHIDSGEQCDCLSPQPIMEIRRDSVTRKNAPQRKKKEEENPPRTAIELIAWLEKRKAERDIQAKPDPMDELMLDNRQGRY